MPFDVPSSRDLSDASGECGWNRLLIGAPSRKRIKPYGNPLGGGMSVHDGSPAAVRDTELQGRGDGEGRGFDWYRTQAAGVIISASAAS